MVKLYIRESVSGKAEQATVLAVWLECEYLSVTTDDRGAQDRKEAYIRADIDHGHVAEGNCIVRLRVPRKAGW